MRVARSPLLLALAALALLVVVYALAVGTGPGRSVDRLAIPEGLAGADVERAEDATSTLLDTISIGSLAAAGLALVVIGLVRRRPRQAFAAVAVVGAANLTTQLLKPVLDRLDPLGGDAERFSQGIFPSGHATVAMSLALALLIVVPAQTRPPAALLAALYTGAVGVGLVLLRWHFPSDVVGGFLIATVYAALAVAYLRAAAGPEEVTRASPNAVRWGVAAALILAAAAAAAAAVAIGLRVDDLGRIAAYGRLHTAFFASAVAIAVSALLLCSSVAALLLGGRLRRRGRAHGAAAS